MASFRPSLPLFLVALWAVLLVTFLALRPARASAAFWILIGTVMISGTAYMLVSRLQSRRTEAETKAWILRIDELVDVRDFEDDGHLPDQLDPSERRRILEELERMPRGSRSLRRAIAAVAPDLLNPDE